MFPQVFPLMLPHVFPHVFPQMFPQMFVADWRLHFYVLSGFTDEALSLVSSVTWVTLDQSLSVPDIRVDTVLTERRQ